MSKIKTHMSRVTRSKEEARAMYNKLSKWYDIIAGRFERKYRNAGLEKLNIKKSETVLEIGFGTGHCILSIAQSVGNTGKVYGIDISEGMFNITLARLRDAGLSDRVKLMCGDAVKLPFESNFFDAIFMSFTLELFDTPEIPMVLQECQRVLRIGGRICVVAMSKKEKASMAIELYEYLHRKFPDYVDCRPIFVPNTLENTGFQVVDITEMSLWRVPIEIVLAKKIIEM